MHDQETQSQNVMKKGTDRPLKEQEQIDLALYQMALRLHRTMSAEVINQWHRDLASFPVKGIEWAMDEWGRNQSKMPAWADILKLLSEWATENVIIETCGKCDTGWVRGFKDKAGNDAVKRCECMKVSA